MASRRENTDFNLPLGEGEEPSSSESTEFEQASKPRKKRLGVYVPLTADGELDTARVKDQTQLEQARIALGSDTAPNYAQPSQQIDRSLVPLLIEAYTVILRQGSRLLKFPDEARARVRFEPDQVERMTEPIGRMLDKFCPALLAKNQEVAAFAAVMIMESQRSLMRAVVEQHMSAPVSVPAAAPKSVVVNPAVPPSGGPNGGGREREFATV